MANLLFITSSTLAANPRLVKAFEAFKNKHNCSVIYFTHKDWGWGISEHIINRNPEVVFYPIPYQDSIISKILNKLLHQAAIVLNPLFKRNLWVAAHSSSDKTAQLLYTIKTKFYKHTYDTVVVHNLGAFYPALRICTTKTKLLVDIEDYHPGESMYFNTKHEKRNRILIMNSILKKATHVTYASPLIMKTCIENFEQIVSLKNKSTVIHNSFSLKEFQYKAESSDKVKFVWFSQNISKDRGLEELIKTIKPYSDQIELHLIGNLSQKFAQDNLQENSNFIKLHPPKSQTDLNLSLAEFDIGLALEKTSQDYNRQICLTNKIWAYFQSGLYIFASNTPAQKQFLKNHNKHGIVIKMNEDEMIKAIEHILANIDQIRKLKKERYQRATYYSWEKEFLKLQKLI